MSRSRRRLLGTGLLVAATAWAAAAGSEDIPRGAVVDPVSCTEDGQQGYALYLPSRYQPGHPWPILYLFDAGARGKLAVERFQKGAEECGLILAASNNSRNGPVEKSIAAAQAVWRDTHRRFSIDDRRVYAGGFSGGARVACLLADLAPGSIAGVIGCSAGFPENRPASRDTPFVYFGTAGDTDFNYYELRALDKELEKLGIRHRVEIFEGHHDWPPEDLCVEAIEWMELTAMEKGIGRDEKRIESLLEKRLKKARELESAGKALEAYRAYAAVARDFRAFRDVSSVETRAADLEKSRRIRDLAQAQEKRDAANRAALGQLEATLASVCASEVLPPSTKLLNDLRVPGLKRRAASNEDREDALAARRMLESLFARTALFLPPQLVEKGDFPCAILLLSVAAEIKPEDPRVFYNRACAFARAGNRKKALTDLRGAIAKGFSNREQIERDPDLASLREEEGFPEILRGLPEPTSNSGPQ